MYFPILRRGFAPKDLDVGRRWRWSEIPLTSADTPAACLLSVTAVPLTGAHPLAASSFFSSVFQMFEIVERVKQRLLAVADTVLPPSFFFVFVIFVSKSIVFLFVTLIL